MLLQNIGIVPHCYMASQPRKPDLNLHHCGNLKSCIIIYAVWIMQYSSTLHSVDETYHTHPGYLSSFMVNEMFSL